MNRIHDRDVATLELLDDRDLGSRIWDRLRDCTNDDDFGKGYSYCRTELVKGKKTSEEKEPDC